MKFVVDGERTPGIELVERLIESGEHHPIDLDEDIAAEAVEALEHLALPWLVGEITESAERFGEQVHSDATRGLQEVVQNADDQNATNIRFGFRRRRNGGGDLLIAHDGNPVELIDVVRMAWPLLSGSRDDPEKIGRFGIGLKTLNQLGEPLEVHCPPVPGFAIKGGRISRVRAAKPIRSFWNPNKRETLFILRLQRKQFDFAFFKEWLSGWDASSLLFLRSLRSVSLVNLSTRKPALRCAVTVGTAKKIDLDFPRAEAAEQVTVKDADTSRSWTRYSVRYPRPKRLKATHKQLAESVRLQLAVPERGSGSRAFVGLPLEEPCELPFSFSAPFEPNVERTLLRDNNELNAWLISRIGDLAVAVSLARFAERPRKAWRSTPVEGESAGTGWTKARFDVMADSVKKRVRQKARLRSAENGEVKLGELTYEPEEFDGLLSAADLQRLWEETSSKFGSRLPVPSSWRDTGRWRRVLEDVEGASPLYASECLTALDWDDAEIEPRGAEWLVRMIHAAREAGEQDEVWNRRCVALAGNGGRQSPAEIDARGTLLVHTLPKSGLAATLGLADQMARPFRARNKVAGSVRVWLTERGVLREKPTDADALVALSGAERESPIDLRRRDAVLVRIRNSFDQLSPETRQKLGPGLGRNIVISGFTHRAGRKAPVAVRPADAYLPSAIDKSGGWPTAAAHTEGIEWVHRRYSTVLHGPRGQGALAFLRALGAATAPRLEAVPPPDPGGGSLKARTSSAQHREELADHPDATGLMDDWNSPDLELVVEDLLRDRKTTQRGKRARALFLTLDRAWSDIYAERSTATAVHYYYTWNEDTEVSASWVAYLAEQKWLSTKETRFRAAAPRELTILTPASFEIEGEHPEIYVEEIDAEHVDSPVVAALQIQGRPFASSILERLEAMRMHEREGNDVSQEWADRCYQALASYSPGGPYQEQSDLSARQIQRAFTGPKGHGGLIRAAGSWRSPHEVRRNPPLDESLPTVRTGAEPLWDLLNVEAPDVSDCIDVMTRLAVRREPNPSSEIRVFRRLLALSASQRLGKKQMLKKLPLRTYSGWQVPRHKKIYAVANPLLAEALGSEWKVWRAPLSLEELAPLLPFLGIEVLDRDRFSPDIPAHLAPGHDHTQAAFRSAVGHLQDYLARNHPALHDRLSSDRWSELADCAVVVGSGWSITATAPGRRSANLQVRAYLFDDPLRLCLRHEDEIEFADSCGQAIASYFLGEEPEAEARSTLSLAWAHAYAVRDQERAEIDLAESEEPQDGTPPDPDAFKRLTRKRGKPGRRKGVGPKHKAPDAPARELVDLSELDLHEVGGVFVNKKRRGKLRVPARGKLVDPSPRENGRSDGKRPRRTGQTGYTDRDREDTAMVIVTAFLAETNGLELEDIRDQPNRGADAVDQAKDIWVELKAHGQGLPDTIRFEPAEAERAEAKRENYWLVVVWDLEKPRSPKFAVIPDPLRRLDTYLGRGLRLSGVHDLAAPND